MRIHTLLCFGAAPGDGNPALVVEGDRRDAAGRLAFARARGTTCVFLDEDDEGVRLDYFSPHMQSSLCLHATLATGAVLFARTPRADALVACTAGAGQPLPLTRAGGDVFVRLAPQPAPSPAVGDAELAALLRAPGLAPASRPRVASVGSPKLLVEVARPEVLYGLAPDLAAIVDWGRAHGVNGIYAWCRDGAGRVEGRNFNHLDPALEDAATGVAAGALALALGLAPGRALNLRQGRAVGRDCLLRVRADDAGLLVGGAAAFA